MHPTLVSLQAALSGQTVVSRFAPSVTGYLHMGHLVNAVFVWGLTRALGGKIILRLEDHDRSRYRPAYEQALLEDLERLGLEWDIPGADAFHGKTVFRQTDFVERYQAQLNHLRTQAHVYGCTCSRKALEARSGPAGQDQELRYDGFCRRRQVEDTDAVWRVVLPDRAIGFLDHRLGWQTQTPQQQCGDLALTDRQGQFSYQFCVVVDDREQGVNLIIRGEDILPSTGRQIMLNQILGQAHSPQYVHHPLLTGPDGRKLSKRDFSAPIHQMWQMGTKPSELLGKAAFLCGLQPTEKPILSSQLSDLFDA